TPPGTYYAAPDVCHWNVFTEVDVLVGRRPPHAGGRRGKERAAKRSSDWRRGGRQAPPTLGHQKINLWWRSRVRWVGADPTTCPPPSRRCAPHLLPGSGAVRQARAPKAPWLAPIRSAAWPARCSCWTTCSSECAPARAGSTSRPGTHLDRRRTRAA